MNTKTKRNVYVIENGCGCAGYFGIGIAVFLLIVLAIVISCEYPAPSRAFYSPSQPQTVYLPSNQFPISISGTYPMGGITAEYIFYGTPQSNGTECISGVVAYPINPENQHIVYSTLLFNTTNPSIVAETYSSLSLSSFFNLPDGYTLLCPNIVNATK